MAAPAGPSCSSAWLSNLCQGRFFTSCPRCAAKSSARESQLNFYCAEAQVELCSVCVLESTSSTIIQVRRSSYHDVVKVADIAKLADIGGIQGYVINGSKVVFLRRRPQPRPPKGAVGASQCNVCSRHLQDVSLFCSLQCKLDCQAGVKGVSLRAGSGEDSGHSTGSRNGSGPETPSHLLALRPLDSGSDSDSMGESSDSLSSRRKGHPLRSHLE